MARKQVQANRSYPSDNHVIADTARSFRPEPLLQSYPAALPDSQTSTIQQKLEELRILVFLRMHVKFWNGLISGYVMEILNNKLDQLRMLDRQGWLPI